MTRWDGDVYQSRFDELAADGVDVHGEASFIEALLANQLHSDSQSPAESDAGSSTEDSDAGSSTEDSDAGSSTEDSDAGSSSGAKQISVPDPGSSSGAKQISVLDAGCGTGRVARELHRRGIQVVGVDVEASMIETARRLSPEIEWILEDLSNLRLHRRFTAVVMAGNVLLFTPKGTHDKVIVSCARHLEPMGLLVSGFQLGRQMSLSQYDSTCSREGLSLVQRWSTWHRDPFDSGSGYAVSVHRLDAKS